MLRLYIRNWPIYALSVSGRRALLEDFPKWEVYISHEKENPQTPLKYPKGKLVCENVTRNVFTLFRSRGWGG